MQSTWKTVHLVGTQQDADATTTEPDDDTSLYRLFGFALFAGIHGRKKIVFGKLKKTRTASSRKESYKLMQILQSLVETDKSCLPACVRFQDRGKMTFPERNFLPFARSCSKEIKKILNPSKYRALGRKLLLVSIVIVMQFPMYIADG